jgi:hypothetical protein
MSGPRTSSEVQNLHHLCHGVTRTCNLTDARRRGLVRRFTAPDPLSLEPVVRPAEVYEHWMKSSKPSAHTTWTCTTPYGTTGISSTPTGTTDRSSFYHLPHREEGLMSLGNLSSKRGEGVELSHVLTGRSTSSSENTGRRRTGGSKSSTSDKSLRSPLVPRLLTGGRSTQ